MKLTGIALLALTLASCAQQRPMAQYGWAPGTPQSFATMAGEQRQWPGLTQGARLRLKYESQAPLYITVTGTNACDRSNVLRGEIDCTTPVQAGAQDTLIISDMRPPHGVGDIIGAKLAGQPGAIAQDLARNTVTVTFYEYRCVANCTQ